MNCEKCQELIGDFLDGTMRQEDRSALNVHLEACLSCAEVQNDLRSIVTFCESQRGIYDAPPNERAMWLRIRNVIEAENRQLAANASGRPAKKQSWLGRSWELSFGQLAAAAAAIVLVVSLSTIVGLRRWQSGPVAPALSSANTLSASASNLRNRISQQQHAIDYWNRRVEYNKARWSPEMRETFDRNLKVIDEAVNTSFESLTQNPHDEVSEEMLNAALNEKLALLKEFGDL